MKLYGHFIHYIPSEIVKMEFNEILKDKLLKDLEKTDFVVDDIYEE